MSRVCVYVDGYNLYHAIDALRDNRLKWLNISGLVQNFIDPSLHKIVKVSYFSALAHWKPDAVQRHKAYLTALENSGVTLVLGKFKDKDRACHACGARWTGHEEKETDVNIALHLLDDAYQDCFDQAIIISQDSDLFPSIKLVRIRFPEKRLKIVTPPLLRHSKEMARVVDAKNLGSIKPIHIQRSQFADKIVDSKTGQLIAERPAKYKTK